LVSRTKEENGEGSRMAAVLMERAAKNASERRDRGRESERARGEGGEAGGERKSERERERESERHERERRQEQNQLPPITPITWVLCLQIGCSCSPE
jgi:hypothetical protein